jgi:alkanesulfonate monooxygenase SsuD/methylene tetrahydromethanopterin reductase-like flavin-dependent oxidoreductase (luciferase family)
VLRNQNFIPHLVVGLPTAGAHVAARIAGALNASAVSPEKAVELVTFRPRYVKASGDTQAVDADPATAKQKLEQAHKKILAADLRRLDLPSQRPLRVLVVDDFSSSGNSIADSKTAIRETLQIQGVDELDVRGAVSRYTSAQRNDFLGAHDVNPIDYMAGPMKSGTREEIKDYIDDDGDRMEQSMVDGLTETGFPKPKPWWKLW